LRAAARADRLNNPRVRDPPLCLARSRSSFWRYNRFNMAKRLDPALGPVPMFPLPATAATRKRRAKPIFTIIRRNKSMYSPTVGRFLSRDPIGTSEGINQYRYVGGNPLEYVDPIGEWQRCCVSHFTPPTGNLSPAFTQHTIGKGKLVVHTLDAEFRTNFGVVARFRNDGAYCCAICCQYRQFIKGHFREGGKKFYKTSPRDSRNNKGIDLSDTNWTEDVVYFKGKLKAPGRPEQEGYSDDFSKFFIKDFPGFAEFSKDELNAWKEIEIDLTFKAVIVDLCEFMDKRKQSPNPFSPQSYKLWEPFIVRESEFSVKGTLKAADVTWKQGLVDVK
jgi:hypothetical protein